MILHACKDDVEHLRERGLGCGLVDEVLAGQVDVVAGADGLQHGTLVDFYVLRGHGCQQSLQERGEDGTCEQIFQPIGHFFLFRATLTVTS